MGRYALGIDSGGTKCEAALLDETGAVVGWGRGGPTHIYYDPPEEIEAAYAAAIEGALSGVRDADLWVAGPVAPGRPREAVLAVAGSGHYIAANEVDTGFACAQAEWGVIVLSGTGSFVHARSEDGRDVHFGGLGPILNDYGSAYAIGLLGLRAAFASDWTADRRTSLAEAIPSALGVADRREVFHLVYVKGISRRQIASLAKTVDAEAQAGDRVAADCVRRAADELADLALDAIRELGLEGVGFPLIAIGSVAQRSRLWWQRMCERVQGLAPGARPVVPRIAPAAGAALLALREMGVEWTPELFARVEMTQAAAREPARRG